MIFQLSWIAVFYAKVGNLPKFCDNAILTKISGLWSIESAVNYRNCFLLCVQ